jgi:hypothetical protein
MYYPSICLEGLNKTTKDISQNSQSLGRHLNTQPEYESGVLNTQPLRLVLEVVVVNSFNYVRINLPSHCPLWPW